MSAALRFAPHYTVDDYSLWKGDWELWEGIAIAMSPSPFGVHQTVVSRLNYLLQVAIRAVDCDAEPLVELDWIVNHETVVRPDVMVVCGPPPQQHCESPPALVAEVLSNSTRQNDLGYKRELYQREGVEAYLMIDPVTESVEIDVRQSDGSYQKLTTSDELTLSLCDDCVLTMPTTKLFHR